MMLVVLTCLLEHSPVKLSAWTPRLNAHSVISAWCGTMTATTQDLRLSPCTNTLKCSSVKEM